MAACGCAVTVSRACADLCACVRTCASAASCKHERRACVRVRCVCDHRACAPPCPRPRAVRQCP
eukprot:6097011-Pleurochrysis_carterae.AAC.1